MSLYYTTVAVTDGMTDVPCNGLPGMHIPGDPLPRCLTATQHNTTVSWDFLAGRGRSVSMSRLWADVGLETPPSVVLQLLERGTIELDLAEKRHASVSLRDAANHVGVQADEIDGRYTFTLTIGTLPDMPGVAITPMVDVKEMSIRACLQFRPALSISGVYLVRIGFVGEVVLPVM